MLGIESFLTAYDPSDLPSTSIDPLGFERGYLYLADGILPGLTNVAGVPRYFSILCAGIQLCAADHTLPDRKLLQARREAVLRAERLWALACALAAKRNERSTSGLRGVRYVQRETERLSQRKDTKTAADYKLLSRQAQYGVLGIYTSVARELRFIELETLALTPDLGELLADAFIVETEMPASVRKAITDGTPVGIDTLTKWGERAFLWPDSIGAKEAACFRQALNANPVRSRMAHLLATTPPVEGDDEQMRLARVAHKSTDADLRECLNAILAYEKCYRAAMLIFERLLWLSLKSMVTPSDMAHDPAITTAMWHLAGSVGDLQRILKNARASHLLTAGQRLADVIAFLGAFAAATPDSVRACEVVQQRHEDIQRGKFDHGRRKLPWLERVGDGFGRTTTRIGGLGWEASSVEDIGAHPYRFGAADALRRAAGDA